MNARAKQSRSLHSVLQSVGEEVLALSSGQPILLTAPSLRVMHFFSEDVVATFEDGSALPMEAGTILVLHKTEVHLSRQGQSSVNRIHFLDMVFDLSSQGTMDYDGMMQAMESLMETLQNRRYHVLHGATAASPTLFSLILEIRSTSEKITQGSNIEVLKIYSLISLFLCEIAMRGKNDSPSKEEIFVENLFHFLCENSDRRDLALDQIAWNFNLSGDHLNRLYRRHTGRTVFQELRRIRIQKAKSLLLRMEWDLRRIAQAVGYHSTSSFCRTFYQFVGCSPMEYRNRYRKSPLLITPFLKALYASVP